MPDHTSDFEEKAVIVTGGTSGILRKIALGFGEAGVTVLNADTSITPKDAELPTHEKIQERGGEATYMETDVSDPDDVFDAVAAAREYGGIDVMVNNADLFAGGSLFDVTPSDFDEVIGVNACGFFRLSARSKRYDQPRCRRSYYQHWLD